MATSLSEVAPAFVDMAHRIVWCTAATVDRANRPRSRVLHPVWEWGDGVLTGWPRPSSWRSGCRSERRRFPVSTGRKSVAR